MSSNIIFLGASDFSLAMMLEIVDDQYSDPSVTVVQNTDHPLDHPFETPRTKVMLIRSEVWQGMSHSDIFLGVNKPLTKYAVFQYFRDHFAVAAEDYKTLAHSSSVIASSVVGSPGLVLHPQSVISAHSKMGCFVTVNRGATIGHHTRIGDFTTIHPGVNVAGCCEIGIGVTLGMGSNVVDGTKVGSGSVIGAGSTVTKDIPPGVIAYGQPAKVIREIESPFVT